MIKTFNEYVSEMAVPGKIVYHGSNALFPKFSQDKARIFNDFYGGGVAYFTESQKVAIQYAKGMSKKTGEPYVYECKINLKNCFDVDEQFTGERLAKFVAHIGKEQFARNAGLLKYGSNKYSIMSQLEKGEMNLTGDIVFKGLSATITTAKAREILKKEGFDGLRYNGGVNMNVQTKHDVFLPYYAESITIVKRFKVKVS